MNPFTKTTKDQSYRRSALAILSVLVVLMAIFMVKAAGAQGVARGYFTHDQDLKNGMVVALSISGSGDKPYVERATRENVEKVIGVTTNSEDTFLTIGSSEQQVYIQTTGVASLFVTDINGDIKKGDKLTLSPLKGILMRANDASPTMGTALEDFSTMNAESQTVESSDGTKTALVNRLSVSIDGILTRQPAFVESKTALEKLGEAITGKRVGELQVIVALVIFFIIMVAEGSIIYGAISSGIISIGRNPMARGAIRGEIFRILIVAVIVLIIGLGAIYLILQV